MIPILFENNDILAVNKPEGLASIPERKPGSECLLRTLEEAYARKLFVVHRIDKDVSGVILFAKNATTHALLNDQFSARTVSKTYLALVHGVIAGRGGTIERPIREFGSGRMAVDETHGKSSRTVYDVQERYPDYTLLQVHPATGRRHQIRVHFYSIGHPIVGDLLYGVKGIQTKYPRLMLHAFWIRVSLPDGKKVQIEAPLPPSFLSALDQIAPHRQ